MTTARRRSVVIVLAACGGSSGPPLGERVGPLIGAALTAADHERGPWRCAAPDGPPLADEQLTVGGHAWKLGGHAVQRVDASPDVVIGVVADAAGAAPATIAALGRLRAKLEAAKPTVVLTLGGMGANERELETTLAVLADKASWPVVALPGDLEPVTAHDEAIATLRKRGVPVIDGRLAHRIELGGATIATVPGAGASRGCRRLQLSPPGCHRGHDGSSRRQRNPHPGVVRGTAAGGRDPDGRSTLRHRSVGAGCTGSQQSSQRGTRWQSCRAEPRDERRHCATPAQRLDGGTDRDPRRCLDVEAAVRRQLAR